MVLRGWEREESQSMSFNKKRRTGKKGDPEYPNLVASSVYDAKPVRYLSMVSGEVKWAEVNKDVYNVDSGEVEQLKFLRLGHINRYNKETGSVDLADQLRGSYHLD